MSNKNLKLISFILFLAGQISLSSQNFSVLTCSKGKEIYSTFGHSAIRYQDSSQGIDWVYNYGLFDFHDPNFIPKFCMGKLDYMVGKEPMENFMAQYIYQQREVKEQRLNLSIAERDSLLRFLEWNILDENKYYRYDFLYNNCATKIIDVLEKNCPSIKFNFYKEMHPKSFRKLIHDNAEQSVPWIDWGMDVALGMSVDKSATPRQYCFLPEFVSKSIALSSTIQNQPLVNSENILIPKIETVEKKWGDYLSPIFIGMFLFFIILFLRFRPQKWEHVFLGILFIILGIGGLVIGFEWFFTEHSVTKNNWNLLWLNPISLVYGFNLLKNKDIKWIRYFLLICSFIFSVIPAFEIQKFHIASKFINSSIIICLSLIHLKKKNENLTNRQVS